MKLTIFGLYMVSTVVWNYCFVVINGFTIVPPISTEPMYDWYELYGIYSPLMKLVYTLQLEH